MTDTSRVTPDELIDPEIAAVVRPLAFDGMTAEILNAFRNVVMPETPPSEVVDRTNHVVAGDPDVAGPGPPAEERRGCVPCVVSMHGGGYVIGAQRDRRRAVRARSARSSGSSASRSTTGSRPRRRTRDRWRTATAALRWTHEHADELGVDRDRIGVMGISAGGGLAAALALLAARARRRPIAFQLLDSPMLDDRQTTASSRQDGLRCGAGSRTRSDGRRTSGDLYGRDDVPATAAPARADRTQPGCRRRSSRSARSTASATRTSSTRCG